MIADLKPYPEYKESGLPWLGQVPGHWEVRQPRQIGRLLKGVGGTKEDALPAGVPCVRYGELYTTYTHFVRTTKTFIHPNRVTGYTVLQYGDVLFAASGETLEDIGRSAVNLIKGAAVCGGDVIILRPTVPVHAPFLGYVMDCRPSASQKATMGRGTTVKHIYPDELKRLLFPLPPVLEQAAIVRFLAWANGRLERAIRAKRKVIALLNEQKQAIIHRAVTGGHSGWPSLPMRAVLRPIKRTGFTNKAILSLFRDVGVILKESRENKNVDVRDLALCQLVQPGDVVMNKMKAWQGSIAVSDLEGIVSPDYMVLKFAGDQFFPKFFHYLLRSPEIVAEYRKRAYGVRPGQWRLMYPEFCRIRFLVPPLKVQMSVAHSIELAFVDLDNSATVIRRELDLLREYRTRLIADVVTGKLDVREAAAQLPDEALADTIEDDTALNDDPEAADEEAEE